MQFGQVMQRVQNVEAKLTEMTAAMNDAYREARAERAEIVSTLSAMREQMAEQRGGFKVLAGVATAGGVVGGLLTSLAKRMF